MPQYMNREEENKLRHLLDEMAEQKGLFSPRKESYFSGFYLDRMWYRCLEDELVPVVAFEIEKQVPNNERLRKDILNLVWSRAPLGYIVVPHQRILADPKIEEGSTAQNWYRNKFQAALGAYAAPFAWYCKIRVLDVDSLWEHESLKASVVFEEGEKAV